MNCINHEINCELKHSNIRVAVRQDAGELLQIYAPYVERTAITFECQVPSEKEFENRISAVTEKYPYLVAERNGKISGYAYAGPFHERTAYGWAAETAIYIRQDMRGMGIGRGLYEALEKILIFQNIKNLNACITYAENEDEYVTRASVDFHQHLGYRLVGRFRQCGYKFNRWYDVVWMEKHIGLHEKNPPAIKNFKNVREEIKERYLFHE